MKSVVTMSESTKQEEEPIFFSRTNPFQARVLKNVNLNKAGSSKETIFGRIS